MTARLWMTLCQTGVIDTVTTACPLCVSTGGRHRKVCTQNYVKHPPVGIYARIFVG